MKLHNLPVLPDDKLFISLQTAVKSTANGKNYSWDCDSSVGRKMLMQ